MFRIEVKEWKILLLKHLIRKNRRETKTYQDKSSKWHLKNAVR